MEIQKPNWRKIELCSLFINTLDDRIADVVDIISEENPIDDKENLEGKLRDLKHFYTMVFNVAFYEFTLAFYEVQEESSKLIERYLKRKKDEEGLGGDNGFKF